MYLHRDINIIKFSKMNSLQIIFSDKKTTVIPYYKVLILKIFAMDFDDYINKAKEIHRCILNFIETDSESELKTLNNNLNKQDTVQALDILNLISRIESNHYKDQDFYDRIEKIIQIIIQDQQNPLSNLEIFQVYETNIRLLYHLFQKKIIIPDDSIMNLIFEKTNLNKMKFSHYLFGCIKNFLNQEKVDQITKEIFQQYNEEINKFDKKCEIGENDSYLCGLIRKDMIEEFIIYVNKTNIPLTSTIKKSVYETNSYLIDKNPTLIEYAAFFGSIQIFNYLANSKATLTKSLWFYGIHSNNAEIINFIEENNFKISFIEIMKESIKCHHIDISEYIKANYLGQKNEDEIIELFESIISKSLNYYYYPKNIGFIFSRPKNKDLFNLQDLCSSSVSITIPSTTKLIGAKAFEGCSFLQKIEYNCFENCSSLKEITIPNSVTYIGSCAFLNCSSLKEIEIPSSVTFIGFNAFKGCLSMTRIMIHSSIKSVGVSLFEGLKSLEVLGTINNIPDKLFYKCSTITKISLPSSVTTIGDESFYGCSSLKEIKIQSTKIKVGMNAFYGCESLQKIDFTFESNHQETKEHNTEIPSFSFIGNDIFKGIKSIEITGNLTRISNKLFSSNKSLTQIKLPSSITFIEDNAFSGCTSLVSFSIPSSITSFESNTFDNCTSLKEIEIPSTITTIDKKAFNNCKSLKQISIPDSVTSIGDNAFSECISLTQISISSKLEKISNYLFSNCSSLQKIKIPSSVTLIGCCAFFQCTSLTEIIIPSSVIRIENNAFQKCNSLVQIKIPSSVTSIGCFAFYQCSSLTQVKIPSSITSIEKYTFRLCTSLKKVSIPSSVTSIGTCAFYECSSLEHVELPSSLSSIGEDAFAKCPCANNLLKI